MEDYISQELQIQRDYLEQVETSFILCWEWSEWPETISSLFIPCLTIYILVQ